MYVLVALQILALVFLGCLFFFFLPPLSPWEAGWHRHNDCFRRTDVT